jgi:murein DD-endopeptidase MepM/ murein hydrolase activator NlpD
MRWTALCLAAAFHVASAPSEAEDSTSVAGQTASVRLADGFDSPVGREGTKRYYVARGFRANGHLGEDWNGEGGGDTDLGDPVFCTAHGIVQFAQDYKMGWGNVIIVRHAYFERGTVNYVDSLYGHLHQIHVKVGQKVSRGQKIGTIGNNHGQYDAHLHFELRKNLTVGMYRSSFPRDSSVYWVPSQFLAAHRTLEGDGRTVAVPINTFPTEPPPVIPGRREYTPTVTFNRATTRADAVDGLTTNQRAGSSGFRSSSPIRRSSTFKVDRYDDLRPTEKP